MARSLMIQGTMSNVGKSLICAGLCRVFAQDGYSVAPFKSQNMALNSYITKEDLEIGRAQAMQAEAAMQEPSALMNPILLKPASDMASQVVVSGEVISTMSADEYFNYKAKLRPVVTDSYNALAARHDIIVIEGAGSPAEINLNRDDFVNMGMAKIAGAPVLLAADIDRGGVFASVYGTVKLLEISEQALFKGIIINKFRGDHEILKPGLRKLEELVNIPVLGTVPYMMLDLDDEDSLSDRLMTKSAGSLDIVVIRLPRITNFTDFNSLSRMKNVGLRYAKQAGELAKPDLIILPGTEDVIGDLAWMRLNGMEDAVKNLASSGTPLIGISGGYQMLGETLCGTEAGGKMPGMGLLPVNTVFEPRRVHARASGRVLVQDGFFAPLKGQEAAGYEIHTGRSELGSDIMPFALLNDGRPDGAVKGHIFGSYLHGLFDGRLGESLIRLLLRNKGLNGSTEFFGDTDEYKDIQYNKLARTLREHLSIDTIYKIMGIK